MITDNAPSARMDVPAVREAFIDLRVAELRLLAAKTAVEFCRVQRERDLASLQLLARRRGDDLRPPLKRPISVAAASWHLVTGCSCCEIKIPSNPLGIETTQAADEICADPVDWASCDPGLCMERRRSRKRARPGTLLSKPRARR
jgi:hypothetical protein